MSKSNRTVSRLPMATSFYGYEPVQGMVPLSFGSGVPYSDAYVIVFFDIRLLYHPSVDYLANTDGTQTALVASWQNGGDSASIGGGTPLGVAEDYKDIDKYV